MTAYIADIDNNSQDTATLIFNKPKYETRETLTNSHIEDIENYKLNFIKSIGTEHLSTQIQNLNNEIFSFEELDIDESFDFNIGYSYKSKKKITILVNKNPKNIQQTYSE